MTLAIERLPEGRQWFLTNQVRHGRMQFPNRLRPEGVTEAEDAKARRDILDSLRRMGVSETNFPLMKEN